MKRGIASDCTGELSSEQFIRQLRDSGKNEPVIEMFVIEAKTIEVCRVATVARLREIEEELLAKLSNPPSPPRSPDAALFQLELTLRLLDYFRRPARYEAMVRKCVIK